MAEVIELKKGKKFTLKEAKGLLPVVHRITRDSFDQVEKLTKHIEAIDPPPEHRTHYEKELNQIVNRWAQKITKLGAEPKGLWLVDFDNGAGYYCWRYPEEEVSFFHSYEVGFSGRQPIL